MRNRTTKTHRFTGRLTAVLLLVGMLSAVFSLSAVASSGRTVEKGADGYWVCVKDGAIETSYTGIAKNQYGWWRLVDGYVDFDAYGVYRNELGWWYVEGGKVNFDYTGIARNDYGWWRIVDGKVDFEANGVFRNEYGWWYVKQGKVDFGFTGLASNGLGNWYVRNGKVDFNYYGSYSKGGVTYQIEGGKALGNGKYIFLTFDDGPASYTDQLLGILDKYGIKVTFFVTNCYPSYQYDIGKAFRAGHAVAVHTYTHSYGTVYRSTSAFWSDHEKMQQVLVRQNGQRSSMLRFPGGSSNTVSRKYSSGVMSSLTRQAGQRGLTYYDWNVDANDAGGTKTADGVYNNILRGVKNHQQSIVLCHDVKGYTVNAMDRTIKWCLQNGYTFRTLQPGGYTVHQRVAN